MNNNDKQALIVGNATIPYRIVIDGDVENALTEYDIINTTYEDFRYVDINSICIGQFVARTFSGDIKVGGEKLLIEDKDIEVQMGVQVSDSITWYSLGNFLITKPEDNNVKDKISFKAMDYTKKFNKEFDPTLVSFPCTAGELANNVCEQCGVILGSLTFTNSDFVIQNNQYTEKESCRKIMQDIGKLAYSWIRIGWDNKCYIDFEVKKEVDEYNKITNDNYYDLTTQQKVFGPVNRVIVGLSEDVEGENIYVENSDSIATYGVTELKIYDNYLTYTPELRQSVIESAKKLFGLTYTPVEMNTTGHPWLIGNELIEITDMENNLLYTYPFDRTIEYAGHIKTKLVSKADTKTEVEYKNDGSLENEIRKTRIIVDKQNQKIDLISSNVDENNEKVAQLGITVDNVSTTVGKVETTVENITTTKQTSKGGNHLYIEDAMETNALEYIVEGKSEQATRSGKNLLPVSTVSTTTANGITFTNNGDGTYTLSGTATDLFAFDILKNITLSSGTYTLSGCPSGGSTTTYELRLGTTSSNRDYGNSNSFTISSEITYDAVRIVIRAGVTINATFKPMLEKGAIATEFEPYGASPSPDYPSEIKTVKGIRNLFDGITESGGYNNTTGEKTTSTALLRNANPIYVKPNTNYQISNNGTEVLMNVLEYKSDGTFIQHYQDKVGAYITTSSEVSYINIYRGTTEFDKVQIEEGTVVHNPVPYGSWLEVKDTGKNLATNFGTLWYNDVTSPPKFTNNTNFRSCTAKVKPNSKITISKKNNSNRFVVITSEEPIDVGIPYKRLVLREGNESTRLEYTFETQDNENYIMFGFYNGTDENEIITASEEIQIEVNDKKTEYEPYKEQSTLIDMNKPNLFDKDNANILNGYISASKEFGENTAGDKSLYIKCKPNTKYSIRKIASNVGRVVSFEKIPVNKDIGIDVVDLHSSKQFGTITTSSNVNYLGFFYKSYNDTLTEQEILDSIKIYEGVGTDDYYELSSIGDTKDILTIQNGQATINQKIGKVVLDGSESWQMQPSAQIDDTYLYAISLADSYVKDTNTISYMSDRFISYTSADLWQNPYIGISLNNSKYLRIRTNIATTTEFKTWLSENPVTVYYELEEPQTIELGDFPIMLYNDINNVELISELDTTTQITYLRNTPLSNDYATNQRVDKTDSDLETTNNSLNQTKQDVENTAIDLHNNYYDKEQIDSIITTTEEEVTTLKQTVETNTNSTNLQISVIEEQLKNGITAVKTETGYTFDKNGLNISKTGSEMSSTLDNDGLSVKRDNTEVLTVRSAGVETENLKVRTYFTIGSHTRVEDYGNGTGFFHIGGV